MPAASPATGRPASAPRLRPGERPAWWSASADRLHFDSWRAAAGAHRLALDVWAALLLELALVLDDLGAYFEEPAAVLARALHDDAGPRHLGPATALRYWLSQPVDSPDLDELPDLVLPERLVARLTPSAPLAPRLDDERIALAIACERRAAASGRTLESWALCAGLRRASAGPMATRGHRSAVG